MSNPHPLLKPFQQAYQNLSFLPLLTEEAIHKFGVKYGTPVIEELEQLTINRG